MYDPSNFEDFIKSLKELGDQVPSLFRKMIWKKGDQILDYGSGAGQNIKHFEQYLQRNEGAVLHCVDISKPMIEYAKNNYKYNQNIIFEVDSIENENFCFRQHKFDKIVSIYVFHWMRDSGSAIRKLYEMLVPGGYFGFILPNGGKCLTEILSRIAIDPQWSEYMHDYREYDWMKRYESQEEVETFYKNVIDSLLGAKIIQFETTTTVMKGVQFGKLALFYRALNPYLDRIPDNLMKNLLRDYKKHLIKILGLRSNIDDAEIVPQTYKSLLVVIQKN